MVVNWPAGEEAFVGDFLSWSLQAVQRRDNGGRTVDFVSEMPRDVELHCGRSRTGCAFW